MKKIGNLKKVRPLIGFLGVLTAFLLLSAGNANARKIYVADVSSNGTGTEASPYKIDYAFTNAVAGDTVMIKSGTYTNFHLKVGKSGTSINNQIVFIGYGSTTPLIYGDNVQLSDPDNDTDVKKYSGILVDDKDFITVKNLNIQNYAFAVLAYNSDNITFDNLYLKGGGIYNDANDWAGRGIAFRYCTNSTIKNCTVMNNGGNDFNIGHSQNCQVLNCKAIGNIRGDNSNVVYATDYYMVIGFSQNIIVDGCTAIDSTASKGNHGIGIKDNGSGTHSNNIIIKNCYSSGFEECFYVGWDAHDIQFINCYADNTKRTSEASMCFNVRDNAYNNTFTNCTGIAGTTGQVVSILDGCKEGGTGQIQTNNKFINCNFISKKRVILLRDAKNTTFENCTMDGKSVASLFCFQEIGGVDLNSGTIVKNCIIYNVKDKFVLFQFTGDYFGCGIPRDDLAGVSFSYNLFYGGFGLITGTGNILGNPSFVNASSYDYHLQVGSPAINAGTIGSYAYDFDGNIRQVGAWDMGAYEYTTPTNPPTATIVGITTSPYNNETGITFTGNGTDTDGTIQGYSWTSDINGELGITATLSNIYLTVGTHQISFKVKDNSGAWSNPVTQTITVSNANGTTLLSQYFNNSTNNFTTAIGDWTIENNIYSQNTTSSAPNTNSYASVSQSGKMIYEWEMNFVTAASGGMHIMCNVGNTDYRGNSYLIYQTANTLQIYYTTETTLTKIAETTETTWAATTNVTYKYKVIYDPSTGLINVYRNRTLALTATAPVIYATGSYISLRTNNSHVHFDNIIVTQYSSCTPPSGTGTISGTSIVCQGTNSVSYTVSGIANATAYIWTLPTGAIGTSTTNTISVNYGTSAVSGNITVKGTNSCGNSSTCTLAIIVNPIITGTGAISGAGTVNQGQSGVIYNVSGITNATSYVWTLPTEASGTSTTNTIYVNYSTSAVSGNIAVYGINSCGSSSVVILPIQVIVVGSTYYEDFSDGVADNISAISGTWAVENNQYSQSNTANTNTIASVPVIQSGKYVYQWKVNFVSSSAAGMHFYCTSTNGTGRGNSYLVFQTNTMLQIYESVGDVLTKKAEASCTAATGETHSYLVIYDPATGLINAYRDGSTTPIVSWTDTTPLTAGSYVSLRTNNTHAHFDIISVDYALYTEDFSDATANNFVASSGTWAVESNQYSQSNTSNTNTIASVPVIQYGKLVYEWETSFITTGSAGMHIMCDASSTTNRGNSYLIFQTGTMLQIYESINNVLTKKAEASCTSAAGQSHTYKVTYDPSTGLITAFRDSGTTAIVSWTDSTPLTAGSYISLRTNSTHAHFDDLSVNIYNNTTKSALASEEISISDEITVNCYPNPFSSNLTISYNVPEDGNVLIEIYDFTGKVISKVVDENQISGNYNVTWNSDESLTNGIYFCRIVVNENVKNTKLFLLK